MKRASTRRTALAGRLLAWRRSLQEEFAEEFARVPLHVQALLFALLAPCTALLASFLLFFAVDGSIAFELTLGRAAIFVCNAWSAGPLILWSCVVCLYLCACYELRHVIVTSQRRYDDLKTAPTVHRLKEFLRLHQRHVHYVEQFNDIWTVFVTGTLIFTGAGSTLSAYTLIKGSSADVDSATYRLWRHFAERCSFRTSRFPSSG